MYEHLVTDRPFGLHAAQYLYEKNVGYLEKDDENNDNNVLSRFDRSTNFYLVQISFKKNISEKHLI